MDHELDGPWLQTAVLCEKVLQDKDGVVSLIRIVDRFTVTGGREAPEQMPAVRITTSAAITLKSGFARGKYIVSLKPVAPSGRKLPEASMPVLLEGEDRGVSVIAEMTFQLDEEGLYWIDVCLGERLLTRMPLRIIYQRLQTGSFPAAPPSSG